MRVSITEIGRSLQRLFGGKAEQVARETGFVERESKMSGGATLQTWVMGCVQHPAVTYNLLAQVAGDLGIEVSPQALQERLGPAAVAFFQRMFQHAAETLRQQVRLDLQLLSAFRAIFLIDSSGLSLPDNQALEFPASGGSGPKARLKLSVVWEVLTGHLELAKAGAARPSDAKFTDYLAQLPPQTLVLCDLGFFKLDTLVSIAGKLAYFITRLDIKCTLFHPDSGPDFEWQVYLRNLPPETTEVDLAVRVGQCHQLPSRFLAFRLTQEQAEQRRRRSAEQARKHGKRLKKAAAEWLNWSLYLTNVPRTWLSAAQVALVYRLRWQIELLFKLWKSQAQLDHIAGEQRPRILCEMYAKLIGLVLFQYLTAPVRWVEAAGRELSPTKAWQTFQRHARDLSQALGQRADLPAELTDLYERWSIFGLKDRRRSRLSTAAQLGLLAPATG